MVLRSRCVLVASAFCGMVATIGPAASADLGPQPRQEITQTQSSPSKWQFSFTPYGWMINVNGDVTARGHTVDVNDSFFEIVDKSNSLMALMGYFEARRGRFGFFTDAVWMDLGFPGHLEVQRDIVTKLGPTVGITLKAHAQLDYTSTIMTTHQPLFSLASLTRLPDGRILEGQASPP